jgi:hypothetical protein
MRLVAQPVTDLRRIEAYTASLRGWLIALLAWFCDVVDTMPAWAWRNALVRDAYAAAKNRIAANLRREVRTLRAILFLRANAAFRPAAKRNPIHKFTRGIRPGVRAGKRGRRHAWRLATAGVIAGMHEGPLRARIHRLRAMLDNPAPTIARILKRLPALWRYPRRVGLVLVASREPLVSLAPIAPAPADSS